MGNLIGFSSLKGTSNGTSLNLRLGLTTAGTLGTRTLTLGTRNIALADSGDYALLCVFNHSAATASAKTACINGKRYALAASGLSYVLSCSQPANKTPANSHVLGTVPIAVNAAGELIAKDMTATIGTPDEEDVIFIAETPIRVVRKGNNWYLGVKA